MDEERSPAGTWGWVALAALVLAFDTWAIRTDRETMSSAFRRGLPHPVGRWPVLAAWAVTTLHLFGQPRALRRFDPFQLIGKVVQGRTGFDGR